MKSNVYQTEAMTFAQFKEKDYCFLALSEECGEVQGKLAKYSRKNGVTLNQAIKEATPNSQLHNDLKSELGDVMWQLQACCDSLGITLSDLMIHNLNKLQGRKERGTIIGKGDIR
jgi:NTP pyrophosphatase (non-canonical NTP hydrolase)